MPKESKNVDKRCTFSSLISTYDHLYVMNDKSQLILSDLICGVSYHTRAALSFDMSTTNKLGLMQLAVPHMSVVFLLAIAGFMSQIYVHMGIVYVHK